MKVAKYFYFDLFLNAFGFFAKKQKATLKNVAKRDLVMVLGHFLKTSCRKSIFRNPNPNTFSVGGGPIFRL